MHHKKGERLEATSDIRKFVLKGETAKVEAFGANDPLKEGQFRNVVKDFVQNKSATKEKGMTRKSQRTNV